MSCAGPNCECTCCKGTGAVTPALRDNPPGLGTVTYRTGTWGGFKQAMLARLSSAEYPALGGLRTRADDDFTIALLDATSVMLDVLTFYQERLVNESFLRTAGQLGSLTQISRLIGYQPSPGVAATTYVAFTVRGAAGQAAPALNAAPITIPAGTQMQSVPAQGQSPQTFETAVDLSAKADWSALPIQTGQPWVSPSVSNAKSMYLAGTATQLQAGDALLFLGVDRESWTWNANASLMPPNTWDVVTLTQVRVDALRKLTYVAWDTVLLHENAVPSTASVTTSVFAFRQRATLFGHNAPNPNLFVNAATGAPLFKNLISTTNGANWQWNAFQIPSATQIDLDASYPRIVAGSWFALLDSGLDAMGVLRTYAQLFRVARAHATTMSAFALSSKVTELQPDFPDPSISTAVAGVPYVSVLGDLAGFNLASTEVLAQSDLLSVGLQPLSYPLYGTLLDLQDLRPDVTTLAAVAVVGKRQKLAVPGGSTSLTFNPGDGSGSVLLKPGDVVTITTPPDVNPDGSFPDWTSPGGRMTLNVQDSGGRAGTVSAALNELTMIAAASSDPNVSEYALVASIVPVTQPYPHTRIQLASPLVNCYDRGATTCNANVVLATQGASTTELLGSGQAATLNQIFTLKQAPLTYVPAITPTGRQSTLQIRVNGVSWTEVSSLMGQAPAARVFATQNQPDGSARVLFGDGVEGGLLPTGQNNIVARYRTGLGSAGNVAANTLTTLIDRPLGVVSVTNPSAATGGQDAQTVTDLRASAPRSVLTLGRAVSLTDYESFATTFAGIAKASAVWIASGSKRGLFLTVAGVGGAALPPTSPTLTKLVASLQSFGNPLLPITVQSFLPTLFGLSADLCYDPAYDAATVKAQVLGSLGQTYSFANRGFGQQVTSDELASVMQAVPGVLAVNVTSLNIGETRVQARPPLHLAMVGRLQTALPRLGVSRPAASPKATAIPGSSNLRTTSRMLRRPVADLTLRLIPRLPMVRRDDSPKPAQILLLDPSPTAVVLGVMS